MFRRRHFHLALTVFWQPCFYGPLVRLNKTRRASVHHVSNQRKSVRSTEIMLRTGHSWNSNSRFVVVVFGGFFLKENMFHVSLTKARKHLSWVIKNKQANKPQNKQQEEEEEKRSAEKGWLCIQVCPCRYGFVFFSSNVVDFWEKNNLNNNQKILSTTNKISLAIRIA